MENLIHLVSKESKSMPHEGYGAGSGSIIKSQYICPCGKSTVFYEKDDIPGFRESHAYSDCKDCDEKFTFGRGFAQPK